MTQCMTQRLAGKIALVTGIGGGIGKATALLFAREGAMVYGCDINANTAAATAAEARAANIAINSVHPCDLTRPEDVQRFVAFAADRHDRIDVLVNAAAIMPHMARCEDMDFEKQWRPTMVGEVDVVFLACKAAWPYLRNSGKASIVNFASVSAFRGSRVYGMTAHCAGKAAVLAMTRQLALEGAPQIRANTIAPGLVVTPATNHASAQHEGASEALLSGIPMQRFGRPEDIALCALFLASDESSWITGTNISVDGGRTAG